MFEVRMAQAGLLKKILEAVKDLITDGNIDCSATGLSLQAMDTSHVSLVSMLLRSDGFDHFRCDRNVSLGINLNAMSKVLKCANNDDVLTMKATDDSDTLTFMFEGKDRVSEFELKLLDIDTQQLGIPDQEYLAVVKMPAGEFQRICRDLTVLGETVVISATKEGVKFAVSGEEGSGSIIIRQNADVDDADEATTITLKEEVQLSFALRYLNFFCKATPLAGSVSLSLTKDVPLVTEYRIDDLGWIRFYLAPKIEEE